MNLDKKNIMKIIGIITAAAIIFAIFRNFTAALNFVKAVVSIFTPFILGAAIAFVVNVPMRSIEGRLFPNSQKLRKLRRPLALVLTLLAIAAVLTAVAILVIPQLTETLVGLGKQIPQFMTKAENYIENIFKDYPQIQKYISELTLDWGGIVSSATGWIQNGVSSTIDVASNAVSGVVSAFIGFIFAIYILAQKERLGNQFRMVLYALVPEKAADTVLRIADRTSRTFSGFLSGQCTEAIILGCMFAVVMLILRMPYIALISVLIAFTALIPLVGAFIGCFVGAFLIFMENPVQALVFIIVFLIIQQIEGNLIYPKVVGESVGLPAMWVLFVVTVGGELMGVIGMLVMIPVSSVLYALFREFIVKRLRSRSTRVQKMFFRRVQARNADKPASGGNSSK